MGCNGSQENIEKKSKRNKSLPSFEDPESQIPEKDISRNKKQKQKESKRQSNHQSEELPQQKQHGKTQSQSINSIENESDNENQQPDDSQPNHVNNQQLSVSSDQLHAQQDILQQNNTNNNNNNQQNNQLLKTTKPNKVISERIKMNDEISAYEYISGYFTDDNSYTQYYSSS